MALLPLITQKLLSTKMKKNRVLKFFFILLAALVTLVLIVLQRNLGKQNEEKAYHASLNKSITLQSSAFTSKGT